MTEAPAGTHPLIWLSAVVLIAMIAALPALIVSIRNGHHAERAASDAEVVREQVQNDHSSNLRDDIDDLDAKVDQVDTKVDRLGGSFDALQAQMTAFMRETRAQMARQDLIAAKYHPEERQ